MQGRRTVSRPRNQALPDGTKSRAVPLYDKNFWFLIVSREGFLIGVRKERGSLGRGIPYRKKIDPDTTHGDSDLGLVSADAMHSKTSNRPVGRNFGGLVIYLAPRCGAGSPR